MSLEKYLMFNDPEFCKDFQLLDKNEEGEIIINSKLKDFFEKYITGEQL